MNLLIDELKNVKDENGLTYEQLEEIIHKKVSKEGLGLLLKFLAGREDYIRDISIALAHHTFRNGPIEDMHAGKYSIKESCNKDLDDISQLSQKDMKTLNKYVVDKIGFLLHLLREERYLDIITLLSFDLRIAIESGWDDPDIENEERELSEIKKIIFKELN